MQSGSSSPHLMNPTFSNNNLSTYTNRYNYFVGNDVIGSNYQNFSSTTLTSRIFLHQTLCLLLRL